MDSDRIAGRVFYGCARWPQKKLIDAARHWASHPRSVNQGKDEAADDLRSGGLSDDEISEILGDDEAQPVGDDFAVWPENARALEAFSAMGTQWRTGGMGGFLGLDYTALAVVMTMHNIKDRRAVFEDIQAMEVAVLPLLNEAHDG